VTGLPIESQTVSQMVDRTMALPEGTRLLLIAPVVRGRKGEFKKELADWQRQGFQRVRINGEMVAIEDAPALDKKFKHDIDVVVDRVVVKPGLEGRLADSLEQALRLADGSPRRNGPPWTRGRRSPSGSCSPSGSPARYRASPSPRSSPGCSPSTARKAPARCATAWA
jgi:hypothetical protein